MKFQFFSMKNKESHSLYFDLVFLFLFVLLGTLGRYALVGGGFQPFPNFEIIMVLTFISFFIIRPAFVFLIPLLSMIFSDVLLGNPILIGNSMNNIVLFTYTGFLIISFVMLKTRRFSHQSLAQLTVKSVGLCIGVGMLSTLLYDVWTNAGWWYLMYPHSVESFISVFLAGIPFMIYHQLSTIFTFLTVAIPLGYVLMNKYRLPKLQLGKTEPIPLIAITVVLTLISFTGSAMGTPNQTDIWLEDASETSVTVRIEGKNWMITDQLILPQQQTVLETLTFLSEKHNFNVKSTFDPSYDATLITAINDDINGENGYYWQFTVNNKAPVTSADNTIVGNGDVVSWHFSQFS